MEIERKWLFNENKIPKEKSPTITLYKQSYLSVEPEVRIRAKKVLANRDYPEHDNICCKPETYMLCIKGNGDISRIEVQKKLTEKEFKELMQVGNLTDERFVHKSHYTIPVGRYLLTVGVVDKGTQHEFWYGEIEFEDEESAKNFKAPDWFGEEVTNDSSYKMKNYWKRYYMRKSLEDTK